MKKLLSKFVLCTVLFTSIVPARIVRAADKKLLVTPTGALFPSPKPTATVAPTPEPTVIVVPPPDVNITVMPPEVHVTVMPPAVTVNIDTESLAKLLEEINIKTGQIFGSIDELEEYLKETKEDVTAIKEILEGYAPKVSVVYSVNNEIGECYYRPKLERLENLEEKVMKECETVAAYTGFFDLDNKEEFKPSYQTSRALEILGYDFLLSEEKYDFSSNKYSTKPLQGSVNFEIAVMDIYKAIGKELHSIQIHAEEDPLLSIETLPTKVMLPSLVTKIDNTKGKVLVFATRTDCELYKTKAKTDMNLAFGTGSITNGEFIVLLADMMHFYGEPVIREDEMNDILQVYGATIPGNLSPRERDAYIYLKARGILNVELNYTKSLRPEDMFEILACVKDEGSRSSYKTIQIVKPISDELKNKGYYGKQIVLYDMTNSKESVQLDYGSAEYYDYYVLLNERTRFVSPSGAEVNDPFIAKVKGEPNQGYDSSESYFYGIERDQWGNEYYHFRVSQDKHDVQVNTANINDIPAYLDLPYGGGIYYINGNKSSDKNEGYTLQRRDFDNTQFPTAVSQERCNQKKSSQAKQNVFKKWYDYLFPVRTAYAATPEEEQKERERAEKQAAIKADLDLPILSSSNGISVNTILRNDVILVDYADLVEAGICYKGETGKLPILPDGSDVLQFQTKYGTITINNNAKIIVVGTILYKLFTTDSLFEYSIVDDENKLYVDYRAVFGWGGTFVTSTDADGKTTIASQRYAETEDDEWKRGSSKVSMLTGYSGYPQGIDETIQLAKTTVDNQDRFLVVLSSGYSLANWLLCVYPVTSEGKVASKLYVYYAEGAVGQDFSDDKDKIKELLGYETYVNNWKCREFEITTGDKLEAGKVGYHKDLGYVYYLPDLSGDAEFRGLLDDRYRSSEDGGIDIIEKYTKGEFQLPLLIGLETSGSKKKVYNLNVNYIEGTRYAESNKSAYKDKKMYAAPAGIPAFYGCDTIKYYDYAAVKSMYGKTDYTLTRDTTIYYGTERVTITNGKMFAGMYWYLENAETMRFYQVATLVDNSKGYPERHYRLVAFDTNLMSVALEDGKAPGIIEITMTDAEEQTDKYAGFGEFSLSQLIDNIDNSASFIISFVFVIFPVLGVIFLTLLIGLSMMSGNKMIQAVVKKTIDPVYILTFGKRHFEEIGSKDILISMFIGYTLFAMMYNGNLLRIIEWLVKQFSEIAAYIRF